jgi:uncharacterized protein (TIGR00645 family)
MDSTSAPPPPAMTPLRPLPNFIFMSRLLQLPLYLGLILAQCVYVYHFWVELVHLIQAAMGSSSALSALIGGIGYELTASAAATTTGPKLTETVIMLAVLGLIDVVMISNLLIMVIVGGYETFVSRMGLEGHRDEPEWLSHVNASVLKVKLATAIIGISSIHLLKTFISAGAPSMTVQTMTWQTLIHLTFLASAIAIAYTDRLLNTTAAGAHRRHPPQDGV